MTLLNPLNDLVAWVIMRIHAVLGAAFGPASGLAWGLSIVILVMLIRLCLVPLFVKQVHAQRKMAQHAPQLQELKKKYKGDKQRLNEETMKFYKENGVNPLAGCLPMIPQMIVFFALFSVLRAIADWIPGQVPKYGLTVPVVVSAKRATIFGVHLDDKLLFAHPSPSPHVAIVIAITVVISATTTFMTVRQSAKRGLMQTNMDPDNPMAQSQKYMQYVVPFFSLTGLYWQYGLVLYWVTTNLWTLGQQYFMFRNWDDRARRRRGGAGRRDHRRTGAGHAERAPAQFTAQFTARFISGRARRQARPPRRPAAARGPARRPAARGPVPRAAGRLRRGLARPGPRAAPPRLPPGPATDPEPPGPGPRPAPRPARAGQNGTEKRGLLRLGRAKPEPEPQDDVPTAKVVRQQPVRQAKSKRSGKR